MNCKGTFFHAATLILFFCFTIMLFCAYMINNNYLKQISKSKSKSCYDRRPVRQNVVVSSSLWNLWPDIIFCLKVAVLSLWLGVGSVSCQSLSSVLSPLSKIQHKLHCTCYMFQVYAKYARPHLDGINYISYILLSRLPSPSSIHEAIQTNTTFTAVVYKLATSLKSSSRWLIFHTLFWRSFFRI
jgi:hypothetical protein